MRDHTTKIISAYDPAIDQKASDLESYFITRDHKHLKYHTGQQPAIYSVRRIPRSVLLKYVQIAPDQHTRFVRAFECSVVHVQHMVDEDGNTIASWEPSWIKEPSQSKIGAMDSDELERFHPDDVVDVGGAAYDRAFLRPGREPSYAVPPSWVEPLERAVRPPAARILADLNQARETLQRQSATSDEGSGDRPTGATAEASDTAADG